MADQASVIPPRNSKAKSTKTALAVCDIQDQLVNARVVRGYHGVLEVKLV